MLPALLRLLNRSITCRDGVCRDVACYVSTGDAVSTENQVIWTADLTYWVAGQPKRLVAEKGWDSEAGHLALCRELGCMPYYWYDPFWAGERVSSRVSFHEENTGGLTRKIWKTPVGSLVEESQYLEGSHSQAITRYPVEDRASLKTLCYLLEHSEMAPVNTDTYRQRMQAWAIYDGLPSLGMPRSPLPAFFTEWAGVQNGTYLLMDEPELAGVVLDLLEQQEKPVLEAVCKLLPPLIHFPDNLTSEVYTPFFNEYMCERYIRRVERLHASGIHCAVHLDGTVKGLLPKLAVTGIDAIEALTPQPVGDLPVEAMRATARNDRLILWGGVPGAMFCEPFTWEDMASHVRRVLDACRGLLSSWGQQTRCLQTATSAG